MDQLVPLKHSHISEKFLDYASHNKMQFCCCDSSWQPAQRRQNFPPTQNLANFTCNMSETLAELISRRRKQKSKEVESDPPFEVAALPLPPSHAPQPEHLRLGQVPRFPPDDAVAFGAFLEENGFAVIRGALEEDEVTTAIGLFWDFLEENGMKRNDPTTWTNENFRKVGSLESGIVARGGIGQSEFQWFCRTRPRVMQVFSSVHNTPDLLTSLDGGNIFRPWQTDSLISHSTSSGWMHVDQGRLLRGRQCIQGLVTLTDVTEETGGFCCIPGSHRFHDSLVDKHATSDDNYMKIPADAPCLQDSQILPRCLAGDLLLWDSRTVHCSSPALVRPSAPPDRLLRMASYICMLPADRADEDVIKKRIEMYQCNVTGTHWPHILNFKRNPSDCAVKDPESLSTAAAALLVGTTKGHE